MSHCIQALKHLAAPLAFAFGCGPVVTHSTDGDGVTSVGADDAGTTTLGPSNTSASTASMTIEPVPPGESSGAAPQGAGCDPAPACDRGVFPDSVEISPAHPIPDIAGYTDIAGSLLIYDTEFVCLNFLSCLRTVGKSVNIYANTQLQDLAGTDNLVEIGSLDPSAANPDSVLYLGDNGALIELNGFASLIDIGYELSIVAHESLETISGFDAIENVGAHLYISGNPALVDLGALGGVATPSVSCQVAFNPSLCLSDAQAVCGSTGFTEGNNNGC